MKKISKLHKLSFSFREKISLIAFILIVQSVFSQGPLNVPAEKRGAIRLDGFTAYYMRDVMKEAELQGGANKKKMEGTFFLFDNWDKISVVKLTDKEYTLKNVNINLLDNEVVFKVDEESFYKIPREYVKYISIDDQLYRFEKYKEEDKVFQILFESKKLSLLKGYKLRVTEKSDIGMLNDRVDRVNKVRQFFILKGNQINRVKLKKKKILPYLNKEHQKDVEKYAKRNELSFKEEKDVIKILNYYNTL